MEDVSRSFPSALVSALRAMQPAAERAMRAELMGGTLQMRSGRLARSVRSRLVPRGDGADLQVSATQGYAGVLRRGGTVSPARAQLLAIPVGAALTATGNARISARAFIQNPAALGFSRSFSTARAILGIRDDRSYEAVFMRRASVRIPSRDFAAAAARQLSAQAEEKTRAAIETALAPLTGGTSSAAGQ